ncbi:MAG: glycosyl transferase family 36 [Candidatus Omnitrophica bacterium]|nr:glycosyl transferase family 36 [Candidatus Omnitrophota bacterium]
MKTTVQAECPGTARNGKFKNPYGYFSPDGREYIITRPDTPRPWVNVMSNGDYGAIVSQTGSGFSWRENSNLSRITRWEQDLIKDEWGKYLYVRDNATGNYWSLTWKPLRTEFDSFEVRYGLGYSIFRASYAGVEMEKTIFVAHDDPVEIWKVTLKNTAAVKKNLSLFSYFEWCLGNAADTHREFHKTFIETEIDRANRALYGRKRPALVPKFISTGLAEAPLEAFHAVNVAPAAYEGDKEAFFGRYGDILKPRALKEGRLLNSDGKWGDAVAALQIAFELAPGQSKTVIFTLGATKNRAQSVELIRKYSTVDAADRELVRVRARWSRFVDNSTVETPDEALNFMTNIWLKYQAIAGRLWAKCAYYQSSGGIGFRDQLQDSHIYLPIDPALTKKQILLHAEQQFPDGTVYHWWHPGTGIGAHTEMTDDLLWLVYLTLSYLNETADESILDTEANFVPGKNGKTERGTLYDHCIRAIDKVLSRWSKRGLPLIGEGDWNDGFSHVGLNWKGESVWLGHFLYDILQRFSPYVAKQGEKKRAAYYKKRAQALKAAINKHAWDGEWYVRATKDDGELMGSKHCREGKIDLIAQTWAVIAGTATPERAKIAMKSAEKYLYREFGPLLLTPAYSVTDPHIGYITRYAPGVRENGGVYTHAATWGIWAQCLIGNGEKAYETYRRLCPILRGLDPENFYGEPYVTPGNSDGPDSPYFGRGAWTWYTGSAAWLFRVAWEGILGIQATYEGLRIDPVIPKAWPSFGATRVFRGATYRIEVKNPKHVSRGVKGLWVDGKKITGQVIRPHSDGKVHRVSVVMG